MEVLVAKTIEAAEKFKVKQILLAGGVSANKTLRARFLKNSAIPVLIPPSILCTDNAAMIASCGYFHFTQGKTDGLDLDVIPGLTLA